MSSSFKGIVPAESVFKRTAAGTEFSNKSYDLDGYEGMTPKDFGGGGPIITGLPTDLQGPNGFNLPNAASMNVITDINGAGLDGKGKPSYSSYPEPTDFHTKAKATPFKPDNDMDGI